jgi:hypothetical protein
LDLLKETDIKYADCLPVDLPWLLESHGYKFNKKTLLGIGHSHKDAYNFFSKVKFDKLINFDAHHDYGYPKGEPHSILHCGNWVEHLEKIKTFDYTWVVPKWLSKPNDTDWVTCKSMDFKSFLKQKPGEVVAIYIAQSPAWVPPHFDRYIQGLAQICMDLCQKKFDQDLGTVKRTILTEKKIEKLYKDYHSQMDQLKEQIAEGGN